MPKRQAGLALMTIPGWLMQGARELRASLAGSIAYAALFVLPGIAVRQWLAAHGYDLVFFILTGGFILIAPVLLAGFCALSVQLQQQRDVGVGEALASLGRLPRPIWLCGVLLLVLYLIWVTDALMIYSVYFDFEPLPQLYADHRLRPDLFAFLLYSGLLGLVLALIAYCVSVLTVPHAVAEKSRFVEALCFGVGAIRRHPRTMMLWALTIGGSTYLVLILMPLLGLLLIPLLAYANMACYRQMLGEVVCDHH